MRRNDRYIQDFIPRFRNSRVESNFQHFHYQQNEILNQTSFLLYIFIQLVLIMTEFTNHNLYHTDLIVICGRVIIIFITLLGWWFTSERYQSYRRFVLLFTFNSISFMLIIISTLVTSQYQHHHHLHDSNYLYSWGPWSLSDSYIFLIICFNCSGLLFSDATTTSGIHILLVLLFPFLLFFNRHPSEIPAPLRLLCLPVLHVIEVVFTQKIEYQNRDRYIGQIERGHLLVSQDHLISSILPSHISKALKSSEEGMTAGEDSPPLAAYYENVTIMFCSIVDFSSQSSLIHPHDTINLSHHLISAMDRIVEQTGAYKVENIGDTFMACAGCPSQVHPTPTPQPLLTQLPDQRPCLRHLQDRNCDHPSRRGIPLEMARWILGFPQDWHSHRFAPFFASRRDSSGVGAVGAVTGGIVGTKSYSYHLFGDVVNTASRMCSHSVPGKILFSSSTEEAMRSNHPGHSPLSSNLHLRQESSFPTREDRWM
jgi:class 3 adenylate cyclase